ncbi:C-C motif chemokine 18-like [Carassius auratus]|uniref:C-C motif chemokine 18-like n=1 Tax=Carassius auratus TaxID=7957 RepID=A0A6P6JDA4_CARAU|nr:C-C motif chemokine 18-like [Carassius auratus]
MWCRLRLSQTTETTHYQSVKKIDFKSETMRASSMCLVFGLVLLMALTSEAQPKAVPKRCCFSFVDFQIPASKIVTALKTDPECPVPGFVVTTPRTEFCVKPDEEWIQKILSRKT